MILGVIEISFLKLSSYYKLILEKIPKIIYICDLRALILMIQFCLATT